MSSVTSRYIPYDDILHQNYNHRYGHREQQQYLRTRSRKILFQLFADGSSSLPISNPQAQQYPATAQSTVTDNYNSTPKDYEDPFTSLCKLSASCIYQSDTKKQAGGAGFLANNKWLDEPSSFGLTTAIDRIILRSYQKNSIHNDRLDRDDSLSWLRWIRSVPTPTIVDLTDELCTVVNRTTPSLDTEEHDILRRIGCRLILLPSGTSLSSPLVEPPVSFILGKLLYGGVTRYRLLGSSNSNRPPRRTGEVTSVKGTGKKDNPPGWMQFGGANRMYESVDMGPAAILELVLVPQGFVMPRAGVDNGGKNMEIDRIGWKPQKMFAFVDDDDGGNDDTEANEDDVTHGIRPMTRSGKERNEAFTSNFQSSVGGLSTQIESVVRRVLDGRVIQPPTTDRNQNPTSSYQTLTALESKELSFLNLSPVRGLLLYGPPGCGKTALAREISRSLNAHPPKILAAPELLDRWVGGSERLVRDLFADAEAELAACGGDAGRSALHVVVIDEIDAVFRKRSGGDGGGGGEAARNSLVNQILPKLDGVNAIPNVLLVGMTNRRELLDRALLRPGRLEVQIEIPLPDVVGRREILKIHFDKLRERGRLSRPLCRAIDGAYDIDEKVSETIGSGSTKSHDVACTTGRKRRIFRRASKKLLRALPGNPVAYANYDLAADYATRGFSGADIAELVRCAGSIVLSRARRDGGGVEGLMMTLEDVKQALVEVQR